MPNDDVLSRRIHLMRRIDAAAETPLPGRLAAIDGLGTVLLVDTATLPNEWPGWRGALSGHVWAPMDLLRRIDGYDVALPVLQESVEALLARRRAHPLDDGERTTLAVSILRGLAELLELDAVPQTGSWWLTDAGRPVFASHSRGRTASASAADLLHAIATESSVLGTVLVDAAEAIAQPEPNPRSLASLEDRLFRVATPAPLATTILSVPRTSGVDPRRALAAEPGDEPDRAPSLIERLARNVDADLADAVSRLTTSVWRRLHARRDGGRRKPLVLASVVAVAVVGIGMLWPASGGPATAGGLEASASATPATASPSSTEHADASAQDDAAAVSDSGAVSENDAADLVAIATGLLDRRRECGGDADCLARFQADPTSALAPGAIDLPADQRTVALIDEFGGAGVVRVDAVSGIPGPQLVVLVLTDGSWLLRDVYNAGQQP